jgi:hypothetical protein
MILTIVASVAVLAPSPPPPPVAVGSRPLLKLSRHAPPLSLPGPPQGLERPTSSPRSLTHRRDPKPQALVPQAPAPRPVMQIGGLTAPRSRRWHRASSPRSPRAPPLPT